MTKQNGMKRLYLILMIVLWVSHPAWADIKKTEPLDKWRIEVGPPGNEFSSVPEKAEDVQPPESVLRWAKVIAPDTSIITASLYGPNLFNIVFENQQELYWSIISDQTGLVWMQYIDKKDLVNETFNAIVPQGKKINIAVDQLPLKMVETLATLMPDSPPQQAWYADTLVGPRYIARIGDIAFYATPGGNIRSGALTSLGGLSEVAPDTTLGPLLPESTKKLLGLYRERFNFRNQIDRLRKSEKNTEQGFRFVAMGDSRSQKDLWEAITVHIDRLDPKPLFVINVGDVIEKGTANEYANYYVSPLLNTEIPHFIAIGNHDTGPGERADAFKYLFGDPSLNYTFDFGKIRFIFLDNVSRNLPWEKAMELTDRWLAETPEGYQKIVMAHKPPSTIEKWAYHGMDPVDSKKFTDLMAKHKVNEVFLGHIHAYSTATLDGVSYTISGGGGAGLHNKFGPLGDVHHYIICDVTPEGIVQQVVRFYDKDEEGTAAIE
ncbi:MAG: metallophosphoesterase [Deltaproteobacteria bacterium]|nr:metallophosphoesterase [Deltaproteobacteria bacterium]